MKICVGVYVQILPKGYEVCANGLIVVKITVAVGGKSGNKRPLYLGHRLNDQDEILQEHANYHC